jgi:hypothetical protein
MNMETIREWLNRQPFEPFVLRMSNGETHEVRHPECVALGKNRIAVSFPDQDPSSTCRSFTSTPSKRPKPPGERRGIANRAVESLRVA